jgi:hypothetical protein
MREDEEIFKNTNRLGRNQIVTIHRQHDFIPKWPQKTPKTPRHYKQFQQSSSIQNQFTKGKKKTLAFYKPTMNIPRKNIGK